MKRFLKLFLLISIISGVPFGLLFGITVGLKFNLSFLRSFLIGIGSGVAFGVLFGLAFGSFLIIFERREISLFAHPKFHYVTSIISAIIGIILLFTKFHISSYVLGVMLSLPFYYWFKVRLRKNIDNYVKFYLTPVEKRPFLKDLQKANWKTVFPLFLDLFILFIIISKIKGNIIIAIFGSMFWSFLVASEYKLIYTKAKEVLSKK